MNRLSGYLKQPYPFILQPWKTILVVTLAVFLVLYIFRPFGLNGVEPAKRTLSLLAYAGVTALVMGIQFYLLPLIFPRYYEEKNWNVGRQIVGTLLTFVLIAVGNLLVFIVFFAGNGQSINAAFFLTMLGITVAVGAFPVTVLTVLRQNRLLRTTMREVSGINDSLSGNPAIPASARTENGLLLSGSGKETLKLDISSLLYIEADGNYMKVNYRKNGTTAQKMLRATIKQMEEQTAPFPSVMKCHRAFLVNLQAVKRANGNSQGYQLTLDGVAQEIPVSRAYTRGIKEKIEAFSA